MLLEWLSQNKELLTWLCGGIATAAGGLWTIVKFVIERRDKAHGGGTASSVASPSAGHITIGGSLNIRPAHLPKAALGLAIIGLALLVYAAFFAGGDCIQGSIVAGDITASEINVSGKVSGDCE